MSQSSGKIPASAQDVDTTADKSFKDDTQKKVKQKTSKVKGRDRSNTITNGSLAPIKEISKTKKTKAKNKDDSIQLDMTPGKITENGQDQTELRSQASRKSFTSHTRSRSNFNEGGADAAELKIENDRLQNKIKSLNQQLASQNDSADQISKLRQKLKESEDKNQVNFKEMMALKSNIVSLNSEINILKNKVAAQESTISTLNESMEEKGNEQEQLEEIQAGQKKEIDQLNEDLQEKEEEMFTTKKDLQEMTINFEETDQKLQQATDRISELMKAVEELVTQQHIYIGHKKDMIDMNLSNYLNLYPEKEKRKILFLRESEGVYQFGQKKVYMKIEQGNQIKVRVGGGYMSIDDFLDLYTEQEVQKIERRDVINRFQSKLTMQKISVESSVHANEISPVRTPQRAISPLRSSPKHRKSMKSPMGKRSKNVKANQSFVSVPSKKKL